MSNENLTQLLSAHTFDGSPLHVNMPAFHVPFDDRGRGGTESGVGTKHRAPRREASHRLRQDKRAAVDARWPNRHDRADLGLGRLRRRTGRRRFVAHLIQGVVRDAQRADTLTARDLDARSSPLPTPGSPLPGSERRLAAKLAPTFGRQRRARREVPSTLAGVDLQRPAGEVLESVNAGSRRSVPLVACRSSSSTTPTASPGASAVAARAISLSARSSARCCPRSPSERDEHHRALDRRSRAARRAQPYASRAQPPDDPRDRARRARRRRRSWRGLDRRARRRSRRHRAARHLARWMTRPTVMPAGSGRDSGRCGAR